MDTTKQLEILALIMISTHYTFEILMVTWFYYNINPTDISNYGLPVY